MRKALYILTAVLLIGVVITGCGKKDTPFEPSTDSFNATQAMESQGPTVLSINTRDLNNNLYEAPTYDEIIVLFDADMNGGTINTGTILLQDVEHMATALAYTVTYDVTSKKATIKATNGWDDDISYLVTVTPGVKDIHGHALDGNENDWIDPQDNYREQFWGFTSAVGIYDVTPPEVTMIRPTNNAIYFSTGDSIEIRLTDNDSVDAATITQDAFVLTTASGQAVTLPAMHLVSDFAPTLYIVRFSGLSTILKDSTDYFLTVKTTIKDRRGNSLDGDGDGNAENETIDRERVKFRTYDPRNGGIPAQNTNLRVLSTAYVDDNRGLEIRFNRKMNPAFLNANYIKIYNDASYAQYVPGAITILPDTMGVRYSLENFDGSGNLWVSRSVRDTAGFYLDQNNNGIPGEAAYTTSVGGYQASDDLFAAIAYNSGLEMIIFNDMVESGNIGWSTRGTIPQLWHRSTRRVSANAANNGGLYAWHCGVDADSSYLVAGPTAVHDTLMMPEIDLTAYNIYSNCRLRYNRWYYTDGANDRVRVIVSTDGGANWATAISWFGADPNWVSTSISLSGYLGTRVRIALAFDTDAVGNVFPAEGFYFDNIRLVVY
ncbi:MAG: Ig-like domain-containing protein [bacterium]|nr:Ig-like domain-containing protein [bacterium]